MMAKYEDGMKILMGLEFNRPTNALEKNATESGMTYMGIYRTAHPDWDGWGVVDAALLTGNSRADVSSRLYFDMELTNMVYEFYRYEFWRPMRLDEVNDQRKADELFVFGVNASCTKAVRLAQLVVGVEADGNIGPKTLVAMNAYDVDKFDEEYDKMEMAYYGKVIAANPAKKIFADGWRNRALAV